MKNFYKIIQIILFFTIIQAQLFSCLNDTQLTATHKKITTLWECLQDKNYSSKITIPTKNDIKEILILCPPFVTGGPEALCQLSYELSNAGFTTNILWLFDSNPASDFSQIQKQYKDNVWYICAQQYDLSPSVYKKKYNTQFLNHDLILDESTLIIIPEVWGDLIPFFEGATIAFYWLSIDNFYSPWSNNYRTLILEKKSDPYCCIHFSDAPWISKKLSDWGISSSLLEAPISSHYFSSPKIKNKIEKSIAYNPAKGATLSQAFISSFPEHQYIPLKNLNEQGIINALDSAQIYIDFGHFPGKDRIPREALMRDCVIFIHNAGCATDFESFPIDDFFRFSNDDVTNGNLNNKITYAIQHYEEMQKLQQYMKNTIYQSRENFTSQIKTLFGCKKNN